MLGKLIVRMDNKDDLGIECDDDAAQNVMLGFSESAPTMTINVAGGARYFLVKSKISTISWVPLPGPVVQH